MDSLRIAMVSPPWYPVPPPGYGGTETVVYLLARELQRLGHRVHVFAAESPDHGLDIEALAPGDWADALGTPMERFRNATYLRRVYRSLRPEEYDLLHDHTEAGGPAIATLLRLPCPIVATVHGQLLEPQLTLLKEVSSEVAFVAISEAQARRGRGSLRWAGMVHNAVDASGLEMPGEKEDYLLQLGRITSDKGQREAIVAARKIGLPLVLAGKVDPSQDGQIYFSKHIAPALENGVKWIPNIQGKEKARLLARARAMLFPIAWEEPFGLAMVEAMASGTPVIAFPRGAAPELIEEGVTGFLVNDVDGMVAAYERVKHIDPERCARTARERFSPERMAREYVGVYEQALRERPLLVTSRQGGS